MLVHVADVGAEMPPNGHGDGNQAAHPIQTRGGLERRLVEVDPWLRTQRQGDLGRLAEWHAVSKVRPHSPSRPNAPVTPTLLEPDPAGQLAPRHGREVVECYDLRKAMLHQREVPGRI